MSQSFFLESLWTNQPSAHKEIVARTLKGPCEVASKLAEHLLNTPEAEAVEEALTQRRCTAVAQKRLQTFDKEISFMLSLLATPVMLCIVGGGRLLKSCAIVSHAGRHEIDVNEARQKYQDGIRIVSVDVEDTMMITLRSKHEKCAPFKLKEPLAPPAPPALAPAPAPAPNSTEQLLARHEAALTALGW